MFVRLALRLSLLAILGRPGRPGVLQLPCPFAAVPFVPVYGVVDVIPFALHPRPELARQYVDLVLFSLWGAPVRSDSRLPAIQLLAMRFPGMRLWWSGSPAGGTVFAGFGRPVPEGPGRVGSIRGWLRCSFGQDVRRPSAGGFAP